MTGSAPSPSRLGVELGPRSYDIVVGSGLLADAGRHVAPLLARPRTVVVTDERVAELHLPALREALEQAGVDVDTVEVPPGEGSKTMTVLDDLLDRLLVLRVERRDCIVALGGGVVGDLAGFAAAVLRRGIDFIQVPTTLLAQVDSSVGGKTAINSRHGKNLIGAFHQPKLVLADVAVLHTLPPRELRAGYAEVVKYGLLGDAAFFDWLERHGAALMAGDEALLQQAVLTACRAKAEIVRQDEREDGVRALLNLGHTFAHAYEAAARGCTVPDAAGLLHGEAVGVGLVQAFSLSQRLGLCSGQDLDRVRRHLQALGLAVSRRQLGLADVPATDLLAHMRQDKKVEAGRIGLILSRGIGDAFVSHDVAEADLLAVLEGDR